MMAPIHKEVYVFIGFIIIQIKSESEIIIILVCLFQYCHHLRLKFIKQFVAISYPMTVLHSELVDLNDHQLFYFAAFIAFISSMQSQSI